VPIRSSVATTVGAAVGLVIAGGVYVAAARPPASPVAAAAAEVCVAPAQVEGGVCVTPVVSVSPVRVEVDPAVVAAAQQPAPANLDTYAPVAATVEIRPSAWQPTASAPRPSAAKTATRPDPTRATKTVRPAPKASTPRTVPSPVLAPVVLVDEPDPTLARMPSTPVTSVPPARAAASAPTSSSAANEADIARSRADEAADRARDLAEPRG